MEPLYPITGHPLLRADVASMDADELAAWTVLSETLLGLNGTDFTGEDAERATLANVLQVNAMVAMPEDVFYVDTETRGQRTIKYRGNADLLVNPRARVIVESLNEDDPTTGWGFAGPRR